MTKVGLIALAVLSPGIVVAQPRGLTGEGEVIRRVELRTDLESRDVVRVREFLPLEAGQTLTSDAVRHTLLTLQGSGVISEAEIFTRRVDDGIEVVVAAWSNILVESVSFQGEMTLRVDDMIDLASIKERGPLISSQIVRSVYDLLDRHAEEGYLEASVRAAVNTNEQRKRAEVVFEVDSGPRATVGEIELIGDLGSIVSKDLRGAMESRSGDRYWPQRVRRDSEALERYLIRRGYRTARVSRPVETYDFETHRMNLAYKVALGPAVEVFTVGADLDKLRREGLLGFLGVQGYDPALVSFSVRRLRAWYQSQGHYFADIETSEDVSDDLIRLTVTIDPGARYRLKKVRLEGNESFEQSHLRRLMTTSERHAFTPESGRLVDERLEEDLRNLRSYYALQGFGEAVIGPPEIDERSGALYLTIPIIEGRRRMVAGVSWQGIEELAESKLAEGLPIRAGGPFHPTLLEQALNELRARYRDAGFDRALASSLVVWDASEEIAQVTFQILEGRRTLVRRLILRGQQVTSPWALRRVIGLEAGDPVSRARLLEIQRRLYGLGVFTSVEVDLARGELLSGERDVVVQVQEGDRHRLSLGAGYDTEDGFRGLFGYSLGNLAGQAASLHLDTVVAQREELYRLLVLQPALGGWRFPLQYSIFRTRQEEQSLSDAFEGDVITEQFGLQIEADLQFQTLRFPLLYTYKEVDNNVSDGQEVEETLFDREKSKVRISSLTAALSADQRDSPVNATRGRNTVVQAEYAFPFLSADEDFLKLFLQQTKYLDLGSRGILGASLRLGGIESFRDEATQGSPEPAAGCSADVIPDFGVAVSERFFAGGSTTHRAYELDTLGIVGETLFFNRGDVDGACEVSGEFPSGGNGLALFNLDYRYSFMPGFWATAFFDSGNVWADWRDISLSEFKDGVGVGLGWDSPIGPLRLEIGWKLDREEFEDPYQVFLSFGTAF